MQFRPILLIAALSAFLPLHAHHTAASHYLLDKTIEVEGVVTKFEMINPHARLYFEAKGKNGEVVTWLSEGNSPGVLLRRGWKADDLKPGERVKVSGRPSRDGSPIILWTTITKEDGKVLYDGNTISTFSETGVPEETKKRYDDLRQKQIREREQARQEAKQ